MVIIGVIFSINVRVGEISPLYDVMASPGSSGGIQVYRKQNHSVFLKVINLSTYMSVSTSPTVLLCSHCGITHFPESADFHPRASLNILMLCTGP